MDNCNSIVLQRQINAEWTTVIQLFAKCMK